MRLRVAIVSLSSIFTLCMYVCLGVVGAWATYTAVRMTIIESPYAATTAGKQLLVNGEVRRDAVENTTEGDSFIWLGSSFPVEIVQPERRGIVQGLLWLHPSTTAAELVYGERQVQISAVLFRAPRRVYMWVDQPVSSSFRLTIVQTSQDLSAQDSQLPISWAFSLAKWQSVGDFLYGGWILPLWGMLLGGWLFIWRGQSRLHFGQSLLWGLVVIWSGWYAPIHPVYYLINGVFGVGLVLKWLRMPAWNDLIWWSIIGLIGWFICDTQMLDDMWYVIAIMVWGVGIALWVRLKTPQNFTDLHIVPSTYRPDIDGMRAIAVMAVVLFHAFSGVIKGGFIGVDVFFVLSGYLITQILIKEIWHQRFTLMDFYERRIRRIIPALVIMLLGVMVVFWVILFPDEYSLLMQTLVASIAFIANIFFYSQVDYFAPEVKTQPLIHLWSLGVEEQFYMLWPLVIMLMRGRRFALLAAFIAISISSFAANMWLVNFDGAAAFYLPISRFWELALGGLVAWFSLFGRQTHAKRIATYGGWLQLLGLSMLFIGFGTITENQLWPGYWALIPTIGTALLLLGGNFNSNTQRWLSHPYMVRVGLISYPLYLWHWPVMVVGFLVLDGYLNHWWSVGMVVVSIILAEGTYRYIETPIRFTAHQRIHARWLLMSIGIIGLMGVLLWQIAVPTRMTRYIEYYDMIPEWSVRRELAQHTSQTSQDCLKVFTRDAYCRTAASASGSDYIFLGDSHSASLYLGMFAYSTIEHNSYLVVATGCMTVLGVDVFVDYRVSIPCTKPDGPMRQLKEIETLSNVSRNHSRTVFIIGRYSLIESQDLLVDASNTLYHYRLVDSTDPLSTDVSAIAFERGFEQMIQALSQDAHNRLVFVHQVPEFPFLPRNCLRTLNATSGWACGVSRVQVEEHYRTYTDAVTRVLARYPQVEQFSPMDIFCDTQQCYSVYDGKLLYYDNNHVNIRGAKLVMDQLIVRNR